MKILILCPFPKNVAAMQRLKYEQYITHWEENGFFVNISPFMTLSFWNIVYKNGYFLKKIFWTLKGYFRRFLDLFILNKYDIIYVVLWGTPMGTSLYEILLRKFSKKLIYDVEDNILIERNNEINSFIKTLKSKNKTLFLLKNADHVITSSPFLNNYCLNINKSKKCTYITSSINTNNFLPVNQFNNLKKITIGWTGTFTSKCYLDLLKDVFLNLSKRCDFKLIIIGNFEYDIPGVDIEVIQWNEKNEIRDLQRIDIGVYPLVKEDWVLGKSGLKVIQYMAFGIPSISTNFGMATEIIDDGINGFLVNEEIDWVDKLETLIKDSSLRKQIGTNARKSAINCYSTDVVKFKYLNILKTL